MRAWYHTVHAGLRIPPPGAEREARTSQDTAAPRRPTCRSYLGVTSHNQQPALIMKLCERGSLDGAIRESAGLGLPLERALRCAAWRPCVHSRQPHRCTSLPHRSRPALEPQA